MRPTPHFRGRPASVVHRELPSNRPHGENELLGRGHERLEGVDAEPFADAVERLEVTVDEHGGLPNVGGLIHPAADDSADGPVPLREGVGQPGSTCPELAGDPQPAATAREQARLLALALCSGLLHD
jgi:hypothetical protein